MKKYTLKAQPREDTGRKTKALRRSGMLPATIYGKKVKSVSVTLGYDEFAKVYEQAGETGLVELSLGAQIRPVLIHNVQRHAVSGLVLHVEFFQVDLKEKVKTRVPVEFTGESSIVAQKQGVLLTLLDELEVEALPTDLPEKIMVDVSGLDAIDKEVKVGQIKAPAGVTLLTDPTVGIVKVGALVSKEAEAEAAAAEAAAAEAASAQAAEGEAAKQSAKEEKTEEAPAKEPAAQEKPKEEKKE